MFRLTILLLLIMISALQCTTLLTKKDYAASEKSLSEWDIQKALKHFPKGEENTLIAEMEKAYLNLLIGKPEIDSLIAYAKKVDNQVRVKATRELKSFFYMETPEGYYASEHEIIWLHLLLSWGYSLRGEHEKAYVEAKICSNLLSNEWSYEGPFDDPLIRLLLGAIWTMCGEWEEAQVDFRAAYKLNNSLHWAKALGDLKKAPDKLIIILGGPGPEPKWDPDLKSNPFRGFRGIKFHPVGIRSTLVLKDKNNYNINLYLTPDSSYWYKRHFIRDNEIQDLIQDTKYAEKAVASGTKNTTLVAAGVVGGVLIGVGGITLGAGIMVIGAYIKSGELVLVGLIPMIGGPVKGYNYARDTYEKRMENLKEELDPSDTYRFVRFLPEYAWVGWTNENNKEPFIGYKSGKPVITSETYSVASNVNNVVLGFYPDSAKMPLTLKPRMGMGRSEHPDSTDESGEVNIFKAIKNDNKEEAINIMKAGADINLLNSSGISPLHAAVIADRLEIAKLLLDNGANVDMPDSGDDTPLNLAIANERVKIAELLIRKGADINIKRKSGWSPLHSAVYWNNAELVLLLLKNGARVNEPTAAHYREFPAGSTSLQIAVANKNEKIIGLLKKYGAKE